MILRRKGHNPAVSRICHVYNPVPDTDAAGPREGVGCPVPFKGVQDVFRLKLLIHHHNPAVFAVCYVEPPILLAVKQVGKLPEFFTGEAVFADLPCISIGA